MNRKKYALPTEISSEIINTVDLVKNNIGTLNYKIVPLDAIEFDPDNPRDLAINREEILENLLVDDPFYEKKLKELESLKQIAETIKKYGVRNAVEIYKFGNSYRLIHGERRCLASILAGKKDIPAKILDKKPNNFDIRLLQLIENVQREDLTLYETINNIREVINEYKEYIDPDVVVNSEFLEQLINRSKTHCLNFLAVLNDMSDREDLMEAIKNGLINNLEKASIIAKAKKETQRNILMKSCLDGASLKQLKKESAQQKKISKIPAESTMNIGKKRPGKKVSKINLGSTNNIYVAQKIAYLVSKDPLYVHFKSYFDRMSFEDINSCTNSMSSLIQLMDKVESI